MCGLPQNILDNAMENVVYPSTSITGCMNGKDFENVQSPRKNGCAFDC